MRRDASVVSGLLLLPALLLAQESIARVGTRVRLTARTHSGPDSWTTEHFKGTVAGWRGDTVVLRVKDGLLTAVPVNTVSRFAVSRGRTPDPVGGALKGLGAGAAVGLIVLGTLCGEEDIDPGPGEGDEDSCTLSDVGVLLLGTGFLAVAGGAAGLVVGTVIGAERWRPVPLGAARLSIGPLPGGAMGVGLALRF